MPRRREQILTLAPIPTEGGAFLPTFGDQWFVNTQPGRGRDTARGNSWDKSLSTIARALSFAKSGDTIYVSGRVREEITGSNLLFDISIIGAGTRPHHADSPGTGYLTGGCVWMPPASPTATTPLLIVRGRGWKFQNILFDAPVDAAAVKLERNALADTSEYDASHAVFLSCRFDSGKVGIENAGGAFNVLVQHCNFARLTESGGAGIKCTSTSVAVPLGWLIEDNHFHNNASHILSSMSYSTIRRNIFGRFTATLSIDIDDQPSANQGEYNVITQNYLSGTYGATAYPPGATGTNEWAGNLNSLSGGTTAADPA